MIISQCCDENGEPIKFDRSCGILWFLVFKNVPICDSIHYNDNRKFMITEIEGDYSKVYMKEIMEE